MSKNNGWVKLYRSSFLNGYYFSEPFTRWQAWVDLLLLANHTSGFIRARGVKVSVNRGQIGYSMPTLAERWKWSKGKVIRFLSELTEMKQISLQKTNITTLVSILNYEIYQTDDTANSTANNTANRFANGPQTGSQTDTNKNVNKDNKEKKEESKNNSPSESGGISSPTPPVVNGFNYLPDGRSFIEPTSFFYKDDFEGLPDDNVAAIVCFFQTTKSIDVEAEMVKSLWEVFKTQELTEQKPYRNKSDVYRHFLNWSKKQSFSRPPRPRVSKAKAIEPQKQPLNLQNLANRYD